MAIRVTIDEVREIIEIDPAITQTTVFLTFANQLVDELLADSDHSEARLKEIERLLAAHFICLRDPRVTSEGAGGVSASYQSTVAVGGLRNTHYGQQACLLDTTGTLTRYSDQASEGGAHPLRFKAL